MPFPIAPKRTRKKGRWYQLRKTGRYGVVPGGAQQRIFMAKRLARKQMLQAKGPFREPAPPVIVEMEQRLREKGRIDDTTPEAEKLLLVESYHCDEIRRNTDTFSCEDGYEALDRDTELRLIALLDGV